MKVKTIVVVLSLLQGIMCEAQSGDETVETVLRENSTFILEGGRVFHVSSRLIASVIYVEHTRNVSWMDREIDPLLADYGLNVSLGLGQVKINTAIWIEDQFSDSSSRYFIRDVVSGTMLKSLSREELINRLLSPGQNVCYIAAYLAMISKRWSDAGISIANNVEILATLYSAGAVGENGLEKRIPHTNPRPNTFGLYARDFFYSNELSNLFPR
jgi:hypothetical protein